MLVGDACLMAYAKRGSLSPLFVVFAPPGEERSHLLAALAVDSETLDPALLPPSTVTRAWPG